MAGRDQISIFQGEDVDLPFTMNPVIDITGWAITFTIRTAIGTTVLVTRTTGGGDVSITDGPNGELSVSLSDAETDDLVGTYKYDLWRTDAGGERCLAIGQLNSEAVVRDVS